MARKKAGGRATGSSVKGLDAFLLRAEELGAARAKVIGPETVEVAEWVRLKCRYGCSGYASTRCCPPHSPEPAITRKVVGEYRRAILIEAGRGVPREIVPKLERDLFLAGYHKAFSMASGPCRLCKQCDLEGACRNPEQARPSMEGCGIDVYTTVRAAGWELEVVRSTEETPHFFGLVLVD